MEREKYTRLQFDIIETYIQEHGQEVGSVSWQMALQALVSLRNNLSLDLRQKDAIRNQETTEPRTT